MDQKEKNILWNDLKMKWKTLSGSSSASPEQKVAAKIRIRECQDLLGLDNKNAFFTWQEPTPGRDGLLSHDKVEPCPAKCEKGCTECIIPYKKAGTGTANVVVGASLQNQLDAIAKGQIKTNERVRLLETALKEANIAVEKPMAEGGA